MTVPAVCPHSLTPHLHLVTLLHSQIHASGLTSLPPAPFGMSGAVLPAKSFGWLAPHPGRERKDERRKSPSVPGGWQPLLNFQVDGSSSSQQPAATPPSSPSNRSSTGASPSMVLRSSHSGEGSPTECPSFLGFSTNVTVFKNGQGEGRY